MQYLLFLPNFSIFRRFENTIYFCNPHERLIKKYIVFVCLSVNFRFKTLLPVETKAPITLDLTDPFR